MSKKTKVIKDFSKVEKYCEKHHLLDAFEDIPLGIAEQLENGQLSSDNIQCYNGSFIVIETHKGTELFLGSNIKEIHLGAASCKDYYDSLIHMINYKEECPGPDEFEKFDMVLEELLGSFFEEDIIS